MNINNKLKIYLLLIHVLFFALFLQQGNSPVWLIIAVEVLLVISCFISFGMLQKINRHFDMITMSMENIKSQDFSIRMKKSGQKEFDRLVEVYNHMIDKLRAERISTSEINYLLASIIKASPAGIVLFDFDNHIKAINPAAAKFLYKTENELLGKQFTDLEKSITDILYQDDHNWRVIHNGGLNIIRSYSGKFINQGFETRFVLFEDFSEEIHRVEKNAYKKLIRMMGHEVNNTAGAVNSVLETYISKHEDVYSKTFKIVKDRNKHLSLFMKRLSTLARLPMPEIATFDLGPTIRQAALLIKAKFGSKHIDWIIRKDEAPFTVSADQLQIEQVLINVFTNAAEAIEQVGEISVDWTAGSGELFIRNNGQQISDEDEAQIFTSFFTTKPEGQGIGLTLIRAILEQHGFQFHLKSLSSDITEFAIQF